jgi:hypothetical protein
MGNQVPTAAGTDGGGAVGNQTSGNTPTPSNKSTPGGPTSINNNKSTKT